MTEIEELKAQIKVLEKKLSFLEELEKTKSPVEEAYKKVYGNYPDTGIGTGYSYVYWDVFQKAYEQAQKDYKVGEHQEPEEQVSFIKELVKEGIKWCEEHPNESVEDWLKPQTHQQVADGLKEAFKEAQKTEKWKEIQKKIDAPAEGIYDNIDIDKLLEKWEEDPPEFLRFVLGPTLEDRIYKWWETCFVQHPEWSMEECVEDLLDIIELFLPKEQSAAGSQSLGVEELVEGFNDCLRKIKSKLRNKKDT